MIFFGRSSLERALTQYVAHCQGERNHQGLSNQLLLDSAAVREHPRGRVKRRQRLGMLSFYYQAVPSPTALEQVAANSASLKLPMSA
jgi:hypothetical protein